MSGLLQEFRSGKDYAYEKLHPTAMGQFSFPLGRMKKADGLPVLFQGGSPYCVPCSVLWVGNWLNLGPIVPALGAFLSGLMGDRSGFKPSLVLERARKIGIIGPYSYLSNPNDQGMLDDALARGPLMIGLWNWPLVPDGHAMVLIDRLANNDYLCVNWADPNKTDFVTLPEETKFVFAVSFADVDVSAIVKAEVRPSFLGNIVRNILLLWLEATRRSNLL